jgi:trk system potassium uptake protein TrkA
VSAVLIVGAGKVGTEVAATLVAAGYEVRMLEVRSEHIAEARRRLPAVEVMDGSGVDPADLESAGIRACQAVAAMTGSDQVNLVVSSLAKFEFGIGLVVARVADPRNRWLFETDMGVDLAIDQTHLVAGAVTTRLGSR